MLRDIQSEKDLRGIPLNRVGIKNIDWPVKVYDQERKLQDTVAKISLLVDLDHDVKGAHMSRFIEILNSIDVIKAKAILTILDTIKAKLEAKSSFFDCTFPYFIWKESPVTGHLSPLKIEAIIKGRKNDHENEIFIGVNVPVQTLCPCSKAISEFGAHNQRANVKILVETKKRIWFEHLVEIAEKSASAPVYPLLKREDEKYVTESAYQSPKFVEDVVRDVVVFLEKEPDISWYRVEVESFESIHNHEVLAMVEKDLKERNSVK